MTFYDSALKRWPVPCTTEYIPTRYGTTFVIVSGAASAPPLILLHGAGTNSTMWAGDVVEYSRLYRVYAVDPLGEPGKSAPHCPSWSSPAFVEWIDADDNDLLVTRLPDVPARHRSLRALFDQSWKLLTDDERHLFTRLSVFRGGFTAESVGLACGARVELLLALIEKSLATSDGAGRYSMHELARRYAADQLGVTNEWAAVHEHHGKVYLGLAEDAAAHFAGPLALQWFDRLDQEQENLRAAPVWALDETNRAILCRFAGALTRYWYARGRWQEGVAWLRAMLARTADDAAPARATALCWCGIVLAHSGRETEAIRYFTDGYARAQQTEDAGALGLASLVTASSDRNEGAPLHHYRAATELFREVQDDELLAMTLYFWGDDLPMQHKIPVARAVYAESLQLYRRMGNLMYLAYPLGNPGRIALLEGDTVTAQQNFIARS